MKDVVAMLRRKVKVTDSVPPVSAMLISLAERGRLQIAIRSGVTVLANQTSLADMQALTSPEQALVRGLFGEKLSETQCAITANSQPQLGEQLTKMAAGQLLAGGYIRPGSLRARIVAIVVAAPFLIGLVLSLWASNPGPAIAVIVLTLGGITAILCSDRGWRTTPRGEQAIKAQAVPPVSAAKLSEAIRHDPTLSRWDGGAGPCPTWLQTNSWSKNPDDNKAVLRQLAQRLENGFIPAHISFQK